MGPNETNNDRTTQQLNDLAGQNALFQTWPPERHNKNLE